MIVRVAGSRVRKIVATDSLVAQLWPQLKVATFSTNSQSCSSTGLLRPSSLRIDSICSGLANIPPMISAGSPPKNLNRKKISRITPARVGII